MGARAGEKGIGTPNRFTSLQNIFSYLGYASKVSKIFWTLLGTSIATAIFPEMAKVYVEHGRERLVQTAEYGLRLTVATALPALAVVSAVAVPLVTVLFERGAFQPIDTLSVSRVVPIGMIGALLFPMLGNIIGRTFYVTKDTHTYPLVSALAIGLYILLVLLRFSF